MQSRIGETGNSSQGLKMEIVSYKRYSDIDVKFEDGTIRKTEYGKFIKGNVLNPNHKSYLGVGYKGVGNQSTSRHDRKHNVWAHMLKRCYDEKYITKFPTYRDCIVAPEWHNYQNFADWYDENYYIVPGQRMELDKDILVKGNKTYSPETCVFVPQNVNVLLLRCESRRGDYPIGVTRRKSGRFKSQCNDGNGNLCNLGLYDTPIEAFNAYKKFKESLIKRIANDLKDLIPNNLYGTLMCYEVDIDD
jgi:hypothetical protein